MRPHSARGTYTARRGGDQYESELVTSPPAIEPRATQVGKLIEFLKNWTEPSARSEFTPPECRLREAAKQAPSFVCEKQGRFWPGWLSHRSPLPMFAGLVPGPVPPKAGKLSIVSPPAGST